MQGKDGLNKDEIEEGASTTRLDQCSTRLLRLKGSICAGRNRRRLGCCNNGSERVTTARRVPIGTTRGASSNYLYCKTYAHSPSKKHRHDVDLPITPTKEWSYRRRTGLAAYHAVLYACFPTQYADEKQGEQLGWVVSRRTRRGEVGRIGTGREGLGPRSAPMGSFSPSLQPCQRTVPKTWGKEGKDSRLWGMRKTRQDPTADDAVH